MMDADAARKLRTPVVLLLLLSSLTTQAVLSKCPDTCTPMGIECYCGSETCAINEGCGYENIDGSKRCFTASETASNLCQIRGWVISARILCIMLLLAPYVAFAMIVLGAIFIILGGDDPEKKITGKRWVKNAIIGALMVIALIQFANYYLQMDLSYSICQTLGS